MKRETSAPRLNIGMLSTLVGFSILSLASVLASGHATYIPPAPLGYQYGAAGNPRNLALSATVVDSLDVIKNGSRNERIGDEPLIVMKNAATFINGWSFDAHDDRPSPTIYIQVDAGPVRHFPINIPRPDVAQLYNNAAILQCGFSAPIDLSKLQFGRHQFTVWLTSSDGLATSRPKSLTLTVAPGGG